VCYHKITAASTSWVPVSRQTLNVQSQRIFPEGCKAGLKNTSVTEQPTHMLYSMGQKQLRSLVTAVSVHSS